MEAYNKINLKTQFQNKNRKTLKNNNIMLKTKRPLKFSLSISNILKQRFNRKKYKSSQEKKGFKICCDKTIF